MQTQVSFTDSHRRTITLHAEWHGGPYIELATVGNAHAVEVINVWDYKEGKLSIPFTKFAMRKQIYEWVDEYGKDELAHDVIEHWGYY